ncbi:MAG: winged helix-turn-helix transcriptional regulator [Candidatus Kariarchaeaceae archaeon]
MDEYLDTSSNIFDIVRDHPGSHFRAIVNLSNRQIGVVEYHLHQLEKEEQIISVRHRGHKLFFDSTWEGRITKVKIIIDNLRKSLPREILIFLAQFPENQKLSIKEVAQNLKKSPSNFHWHIKRMIEDQLIIPVRRGRKVTLSLGIDEELINSLGSEIFPNRWDKFLDEIEARFGR